MWSHNKWIHGTKLTYFEGEFLLKIWGDSFLWLTVVKTITREFLSERKRSFEVFIDNLRLPSFLYLASYKLWSRMCVKLGWRPWHSGGGHSSPASSVIHSWEGGGAGNWSSSGEKSKCSDSDRPEFETFGVISSWSPDLLVSPFPFPKIGTKWYGN